MSSEKFGRNYELTIQPPPGISDRTLVIGPPITCQVQVTRNTLASANTCNLTLYNLGPNTRNAIFKDRYDTLNYWGVRLRAGYGDRLFQIFRGNILRSESSKERTDWVTTIECLDGLDAIQNGRVSTSVSAGTSQRDVLKSITSNVGNLISGYFSEDTLQEASRGQVYFGPATEAIDEVTDGNYFIDNETLNVLGENDLVPSPIVTLDPRQLLTTPKRNDTYLDVEILFSPELNVGQQVRLESLEAIYNGDYKVEGFEHNVMFSESISGDARTTLNLFAGSGALREAQR